MIRVFRDWLSEWWGLVLLVMALFALAALLVWAMVQDEKTWAAWSKEHHCEKVAHTEGGTSTGYGITSSGQAGVVFVNNPAMTSWKCDDGVTYTRED